MGKDLKGKELGRGLRQNNMYFAFADILFYSQIRAIRAIFLQSALYYILFSAILANVYAS